MNLNRHCILLLLMAILMIPSQDLSAKKKKQVKEPTDRELWAEVLYRMAEPVLSNMSEGKLQQNMLVELSPTWDGRNKKVSSGNNCVNGRSRVMRRLSTRKVPIICCGERKGKPWWMPLISRKVS